MSKFGNLRTGNKSDLLGCLEKLNNDTNTAEPVNPHTDVLLLDGAAIVHMLEPGTAKTFKDYCQDVFIPYLLNKLQNVKRLDIVWDIYKADSLKSMTRDIRGHGTRRRVADNTEIPKSWKQFLRVDDNKSELFRYLANCVADIKHDKTLITTFGEGVLCNAECDTSNLSPCNHEEADTRIVIHAADAVAKGLLKLLIRTVDTDVVVLLIAFYERLAAEEVWILFGTGQSSRYIPIHIIARNLGHNMARALPMVHAFTGCDTVSYFSGIGKTTVWKVWHDMKEITETFNSVLNEGFVDNDDCMSIIERFVILLYNKTSDLTQINMARKQMFTNGRQIDAIPPTHDALIQHTKRAIYQGGYIWMQSLQTYPTIPSPSLWGWTRQDENMMWQPIWTTLPEASKSCQELLKCGCKQRCAGRCKCVKAKLNCTALCKCGGNCCLENT